MIAGREEVILSHPADFIVLKKIHSAGGGREGGGGEQLVAASWSDGKTEHVFISKIAGHPLGAGQFSGMEYELVVSMKLKFLRKIIIGYRRFYCCNRSV